MTHRPLNKNVQYDFLQLLQQRFEQNMHRHKHLTWQQVMEKLIGNVDKICILYKMEQTGGEPDVVSDEISDTITFVDCSKESPMQRRSLCYDQNAWQSRKQNKPQGNAIDFATEIGIEMLTEEQYCWLQTFEGFDTKTSSWLKTPKNIRDLGGAIFGDRRYNQVFIYHNGVESYYAARGFRGMLKL